MPVVYLRLFSDRERIVVEVWDSNLNPPVARQAGTDDERGRGLMLVEALCEQWNWGTAAGWQGKVVWAVLKLT
jgi:two-component sensor histidine kinase